MSYILGFLSIIIWFVGLFNVNNMTAGVFCAASACWFAILVRIHLASAEHKEFMDYLRSRDNQPNH